MNWKPWGLPGEIWWVWFGVWGLLSLVYLVQFNYRGWLGWTWCICIWCGIAELGAQGWICWLEFAELVCGIVFLQTPHFYNRIGFCNKQARQKSTNMLRLMCALLGQKKIPQSRICPAPCVLRRCTVVFVWKCRHFCSCTHGQDNAAYIIFIMWNYISGLDAWYHFRFNISCGVAVTGKSHKKKILVIF